MDATKLTPADLHRYYTSRATIKLVGALVAKRLVAKNLRAEIDALVAPHFERFVDEHDLRVTRLRRGKSPILGERVQREDALYMVAGREDVIAKWDDIRNSVIRAAGYETVGSLRTYPDGRVTDKIDYTCPACVAESDVVDAESALLAHGNRMLGLPAEIYNPKLREECLNILTASPAK